MYECCFYYIKSQQCVCLCLCDVKPESVLIRRQKSIVYDRGLLDQSPLPSSHHVCYHLFHVCHCCHIKLSVWHVIELLLSC